MIIGYGGYGGYGGLLGGRNLWDYQIMSGYGVGFPRYGLNQPFQFDRRGH